MYIVYIMRRVYCVITVLSYYYRMETTPLHDAARAGQDAVVQLLLTNGADPNKVNNVSIINNEVYVLIVYYIYCITV